MKICFLVINYNGIKFLKSHLDKLRCACQDADISLIITDDNSTDGSLGYLETDKYDYTLNQGNNRGFAANVNNGIRYAMTIDDFDYFMIANNDIEIKDGSLELVEKILLQLDKLNEKAGIIGFDEILLENKAIVEQFDVNKYSINESLEKVKSVPGFLFIVSCVLINNIGLLDEEYYMYGEDCDYFTRTGKAGYVIYNTHIPVMHYSEGSSSSDEITSWYVYRNTLLYAQKNFNFFGVAKAFMALVWIIYNPVYGYSKHPSNLRIRRNGFFHNNRLLFKSVAWNINYYIKKKAKYGTANN